MLALQSKLLRDPERSVFFIEYPAAVARIRYTAAR